MRVCTHGDFIVLPPCNTMTCYPSQSHYLDKEPTSSCSILILLNARLGSNKYQPGLEICEVQIQTYDLRIPQSSRTGHRRFTHLATRTGWIYMLHILSNVTLPCYTSDINKDMSRTSFYMHNNVKQYSIDNN